MALGNANVFQAVRKKLLLMNKERWTFLVDHRVLFQDKDHSINHRGLQQGWKDLGRGEISRIRLPKSYPQQDESRPFQSEKPQTASTEPVPAGDLVTGACN